MKKPSKYKLGKTIWDDSGTTINDHRMFAFEGATHTEKFILELGATPIYDNSTEPLEEDTDKIDTEISDGNGSVIRWSLSKILASYAKRINALEKGK